MAAFAASDHARAMTATKLNITCGAELDQANLVDAFQVAVEQAALEAA